MISAKCEYACMTMLELAHHYKTGNPVQTSHIANENKIPTPFLVQILQELKKSKLVVSTRGSLGGYRLAVSPTEITLAMVIEAIEGSTGPLASASEDSPFAPMLMEICSEMAQARLATLSTLNLADLVQRAAMSTAPMWYI